MCFHDERYTRLRNMRVDLYNSIVKCLKDGTANTSRLNAQFRKLKEIDDGIGAIMLEHMALFSVSQNGNKVVVSEADLDSGDLTEEQSRAYEKIKLLQRRLAFKFDSIETDMLEVESAVNTVSKNSTYSAADGIHAAIRQLRSFINDSNESLTTQEEKDLYADTADRISDYLDERVRIYNNKLAQLRKKRTSNL